MTKARVMVAKRFDQEAGEYVRLEWDDPSANIWSIEALGEDDLWFVEGDIIDKALADTMKTLIESGLEELLERNEARLRVYRRRGQEHREMEASLMLAQNLLHRAATITVGYRGIVPIFAQEYDKKLKAELESYQAKEPSTTLKCYVAQCQVEVLEEAASLVQGYSKRLVENKIRILKKVADEGVCDE